MISLARHKIFLLCLRMANFPGPGSIILRGRGKSIIDPGSEDDPHANPNPNPNPNPKILTLP